MTTRLAGLLLALVLSSATTAADRPNILFCLADDWGWPHAAAYADETAETPAFDRIASEGVLFQRAYVSSPSCTPSRNSILTGQQFYRLDEGANLHSSLDPRHPNFMFLLRDAGYQIGHWRKVWGPGDPLALGYKKHPCGPPKSFAKFFRERDKSKPFCFWFGTADPHRPYEKGAGIKSGIDPAKIRVPDFYPDTPEIRSDLADYYFEVARWDRDVAAAMQQLEEAGELENTLIVITGDHGMPFPRCKGNLYDWGSRVPLAMRWGARIEPGQVVDDFVSLTDLAPTFLEAAGVAVPDEMTGRSLLPMVTSETQSAEQDRDFVVYGRERHTPAQAMPSMDGYPSRAIRTDRWLLIQNFEPDRWPTGVASGATHPIDKFADTDDGPTKQFFIEHQNDPQIAPFFELSFGKRPAVELYDCQADPDQVKNLASDPAHAATVAELRTKLMEYLEQTGDPRPENAPFDEYPYRAKYLETYLKEHGH
ncbi:sulfatase family protein [Aeoliella sp. SH292]|uniref:sulfatase family protein n=1 Tax=Aeoliella sp. SH292 TaxID=3454464 RepID=UPI003F95FA8B